MSCLSQAFLSGQTALLDCGIREHYRQLPMWRLESAKICASSVIKRNLSNFYPGSASFKTHS